MSNRYPRRAALAGQQSKPGQKFRPLPANDNLPGKRAPLKMPRPPLPANDNFPGRLPKAPAGIPPATWRRLVPGLLGRGIPIIGWAWTAWELYNLYKDWAAGKYQRPPIGWLRYEYAPKPNDRPTFGVINASWGGTHKWTDSGYLTGSVRRLDIHAPADEQFPLAHHFWWKDIIGGNIPPGPYIGVESVWAPIVGAPLYLPPAPVFIPYVNPVPQWGIPSLPLAPMPVPIPKPVRLPGIAFPGDGHNPDADGYDDPGLKYRRKPKPQNNVAPGDKPAQARRPKRKEKERKVTGSKKHLQFLGWILSQYSEIGDLVDALHSALPEALQVDGPMPAKLKALYQHWAEVDMTQAVQNMVEDMVTDPKWAGVFEEMQQRQEEFGLDLGGLKGLEGSSGIWPTLR